MNKLLKKYVMFVVTFFLFQGIAFSADISLTREWEWSENNMEIYSPVFSEDNKEIAFVRKLHWPDGHEAELFSEKELLNYRNRLRGEPRFADPEVVIIQIGKSSLEKIGWGWDPSFSPDNKAITYTYQKKPISGLRVLADTLKGNEIVVYDRALKKTTTFVTPSSGYLANPIFSPNGLDVIFSFADAVNGAYGGNVGVGSININSKKQKILLPPKKEQGLYCLLGPILPDKTKVIALRMKPASSGTFLADNYHFDLLNLSDGQKIIYSWGKQRIGFKPPFEIVAGDSIVLYDNAWLFIDSKSQKIIQRLEAEKLSINNIISPNGKMVINFDKNNLAIYEIEKNSLKLKWNTKGVIHDVTWSHDSKKLAVLVTTFKDKNEDIFAFDKLIVLKVP